jgi:hypothetical protein
MTIDADSEGFGYVLGNDDEAIIRIDPTTGDQEFLRLNAEIMNFTVIGPGEIVAFTRDAGYGGGSPLFRLVRFDTVSMEKVEISGPYPPFPFLMGSEYTQLVADVLGRSYPREVVQYDEETVLVVRSGYPHIVIGKIDLNSGDGATVAGKGKGGYSGDGGSSLEAMLSASAIAVEPDGALLIGGGSETRGVRIRRVLPPLPTRDVRLGPE